MIPKIATSGSCDVWCTTGSPGLYIVLPESLDGRIIAAVPLAVPGALNLAWQIADVNERAQSRHAVDARRLGAHELLALSWPWDQKMRPVDRRGRVLANRRHVAAIIFEKSLYPGLIRLKSIAQP